MKIKHLLLTALIALVGGGNLSAQTYRNGKTVAPGKYFFLYNIGSGKFITDGLNYGTRGTTDNAGRFITIAENNGTYSIYTYNHQTPTEKAGYLTENGYVDTPDAGYWTFESASRDGYTNVYKLKINNKYLTYVPDGDPGSYLETRSEADGDNSLWIIVSMTDRNAQNDYTYLLLNTDMNHPWEREGWKGLTKNDYVTEGVGGDASNRNQEFYNKNFDIYQEISNIPNGKWKITCQGFYRGVDADNRNAMIYINDVTTPLKSIYADAKDAQDLEHGFRTVSFSDKCLPDNQSDVSKAFNAGYYTNELEAIVTNGTLKVGFKKTDLVAWDWTAIDNIKLYYLGPDGDDVTPYITDPSFEDQTGWTYADGGRYLASTIAYDGAKLAETAGWNTHNGEVSQTISNVPNGKYQLTAYFIAAAETTMKISLNGTESTSTTGIGDNVWKCLTVDGYVTDGTLTIKGLSSTTNNTNWANFDNFKLTLLESAATMTVNAAAQYGTFCAPFDVTVPSGVTASTATLNADGNIDLESVGTTIPANTPVILSAEAGLAATTFYGKAVEGEPKAGILTGVYEATPAIVDTYILQKNDAGVGFYRVRTAGITTIAANRCYMTKPAESNAKPVYFFDDNATAADTVVAENAVVTNGKYAKNGKLIIVANGKKYNAAAIEIK